MPLVGSELIEKKQQSTLVVGSDLAGLYSKKFYYLSLLSG